LAHFVRILVADDDPAVLDAIMHSLEREHFEVETAGDGEEALEKARASQYDVVILNVMMPRMFGTDVCRNLRAESDVPIILLSARDSEIDRVLGLELGADDYVTKPFSPAELVARVKAVLRRAEGPAAPEIVQVGTATIDVGRREVRVADEPVPFTTKEFDLLRFLAERPGLALSRQQILDGVWGYDWFGDVRTVDVHIAQVRKKIDSAVRIDTVRGVGYRLDAK
jgi:DNA-binding response OmpR family regulator